MATVEDHPLFSMYPDLARRVEHVSLGAFPTGVERLRNLEKRLGFRSLWIKRDDTSGELHGGNKVRKLEYLLAGLSGQKNVTVKAYGPISSNWTLACAVYARVLGLGFHLLLFRIKGVVANDDAVSLEMDLSNDVEVLSGPVFLIPKLVKNYLTRTPARRLVILPPGGTSSTSILGYVNAYFELLEQVDAGLVPLPDVIVLPHGTGGTAAGLAAAAAMAEKKCRILGVRVAARIFSNAFVTRALAGAAVRIVTDGSGKMPVKVTRDHINVDGGFAGSGYGVATPEGLEAARIVEAEEGITLDTTYTAKAMACLIGRAREGWGRGENILFWHTLNSVPLEVARTALA